MKIVRVELRRTSLPLIRRFRTSSSEKTSIEHILIHVTTDTGHEGWGECASPADPYYCPETVGTCLHILNDFLIPLTLGKPWSSIDEFVQLYRLVKGNNFAKSGLEMACWDAFGKSEGRSLSAMLGGTRSEIESGVSLGIEQDHAVLLDLVGQYLDEGYRRIKLKIAPGNDVAPVEAVRKRYGSIPLQVDANSAYTLKDVSFLKALDDFDLLLIEQPLAHDDIIDHAKLQAQIKTPICLDESIHSAEDARKALELDAGRIINIKVSRVGGLREAKAVHDVCRAHGIPVWCGGMHEFGIGRGANVSIASLAGFTLPGDVSGSDKYYHFDLFEPTIRADRGLVEVPTSPGIGYAPILERIGAATSLHHVQVSA